MAISVKVDSGNVVVSLGEFASRIRDVRPLLSTIGAGQLVSIRRTFADEGSPAGSWPPLSPVSLRWKKYTGGHKLLIDRGILINSINAQVQGNAVVIGTNVRYAGVHQSGFSGAQSVKGYSYSRSVSTRDRFAKEVITNKLNRKQTVTRKTVSGVAMVTVKPFTRTINIPARPFLVFRPEDPARIQKEVEQFVQARAKESGL